MKQQKAVIKIYTDTNRLLGEYKKKYKLKNRSQAIELAIGQSNTLNNILTDLAKEPEQK